MSTKEPAQLTVIKGVIDGAYPVKQTARKLGISVRWVKHLKKVVREQGDGAVSFTGMPDGIRLTL
jgi:hypothetical protein